MSFYYAEASPKRHFISARCSNSRNIVHSHSWLSDVLWAYAQRTQQRPHPICFVHHSQSRSWFSTFKRAHLRIYHLIEKWIHTHCNTYGLFIYPCFSRRSRTQERHKIISGKRQCLKFIIYFHVEASTYTMVYVWMIGHINQIFIMENSELRHDGFAW